MRVSRTYFGGSETIKSYVVGATFANAGVIPIAEGNTVVGGPIPSTSTARVDSFGLCLEAITYDATPFGGTLGQGKFSVRSDNVINARMSGTAVEGADLVILTNTAADLTAPDTCTSADVDAADLVSGTMWRYQDPGDEATLFEQGRIITSTSGSLITIIPDLTTAINIGDRFLSCVYSDSPLDGTATTDGSISITTTTLLTEVDALAAAATANGEIQVVNLLLRSEIDSEVEFLETEHVHNTLN